MPVLHLDSIALYATMFRFEITQEDGNRRGFEREVAFNASRAKGCAFTVGSVGNYSIAFSAIERAARA
jgi:hypothetical protein